MAKKAAATTKIKKPATRKKQEEIASDWRERDSELCEAFPNATEEGIEAVSRRAFELARVCSSALVELANDEIPEDGRGLFFSKEAQEQTRREFYIEVKRLIKDVAQSLLDTVSAEDFTDRWDDRANGLGGWSGSGMRSEIHDAQARTARRAHELHSQGASIPAIAKRFGLTQKQVRNAMKAGAEQ